MTQFRKFVKGWIFAGAAIFSMFAVLSCGEDSGLGASVDTEAPVLAITYPPASSAVKGDFVLAGSCTDDKAVARVEVSVRNIDNNTNYGTYSATVNQESNSWSVELNKFDEENPEYYNGWQFPDGNYKFDVTAYDDAGHSSGTSSQSFDIDNTAPVFVISKPGVVRKDNVDNPKKVSKYGSCRYLAYLAIRVLFDNHSRGGLSLPTLLLTNSQ